MKLARRTLLYSLIIALALVILLTGYMYFLLPPLFVDHQLKENAQSLIRTHDQFVKNRDYHQIPLSNPTSTFSIVLSASGYEVEIDSATFHLTYLVTEEPLKELIDVLRRQTKPADVKFDMDGFMANLVANIEKAVPGLKLQTKNSPYFDFFSGGSFKAERIGQESFLMTTAASDGKSSYTNHIAVTKLSQETVISLMSSMTPNLNDLRPVVLTSLPVIALVSLLLVFLGSAIFSRTIVTPIEKLARHADFARSSQKDVKPLAMKGSDEISSLAASLDALYAKLRSANEALEEENRRQLAFLRASSHQLKTPLSAALLLTDGMIQKVGHYAERDAHLPELKQQLKGLQRMVDDMLSLNQAGREIQRQHFPVKPMLEQMVERFKLTAQAREIHFHLQADDSVLYSDASMYAKILDNLFSNAVVHSKAGSEATITYREGNLTIFNQSPPIDKDTLKQIFEPFVTSQQGATHGLGLYIVKVYADLLALRIEIRNVPGGVETTVQSA